MSEQQNAPELYAALFAVQQELEGIVKGENNPFFKSKYADRTTILQVLKPIFGKHKLLLVQAPVLPPFESLGSVQQQEDKDYETTPVIPLALSTTIIHVPTGQSISSTAIVPMPQPDPQGFGSALTYTSRYSIISLLALPLLDDDDGNAASPYTTSKATKGKMGNGRGTRSPATTKGTETSTDESTQQTTSASTADKTKSTTTAPAPSASNGGKRKLWGGK